MIGHPTAMRAAVAGFFLVAGTSGLYGASSLDCGLRGLAGGAALYALAVVAGRLVDVVCGSGSPAGRTEDR